jgi:hypothetical protein
MPREYDYARKDLLIGITQKIQEIMIPLSDAAIATVDAPLIEVIPALRELY